MEPIVYIDRISGQKNVELVYGEAALKFLYGDDLPSKLLGAPLLHFLARNPICSYLYGWWQKQPWSKKKIAPFIEQFQVDTSEFLDDVNNFASFNDFFIRKLKPECRPIADPNNEKSAIIPADGRYRFYQDIDTADGFVIKGEKFDVETLLDDATLAAKYRGGSMVLARLCPSDYHRFHFPCHCVAGPFRLINGWLYSVNPWAIKKDIDIFTKNKRSLCLLNTQYFGTVAFVAIGATSVGSIHETYVPTRSYAKGDEKGYFEFGASSLVLLFEQGKIQFEQDLIAAAQEQLEIKCLMGQLLGFRPKAVS